MRKSLAARFALRSQACGSRVPIYGTMAGELALTDRDLYRSKMKHQLSAVLTALAFAACAHRPASVLAPEPAPEAAPPAVVREPAKVLPPPAVVHPSPAPAPSGGARVSADSAKRDRATLTKADITKSAVAVFGDSVAAGAPAFLPTWDIDVRSYEAQTRVQHYVAMYTGPARDRIMERLQVGARYEPIIRAKFREGGLPEDLYYLALIESGFDPNAYSKAAAVGMWQFMTSTARDMGMRVDWWG